MKKVLYVTSFTHKIYEKTGKTLINTYFKTNQTGDLLLCHEKMPPNFSYPTLLTYNLEKDEYLNTWLTNNKDIIPTELGGLATKESHPELYDDTIVSTNNYRASKFFRKVASLKYAVDTYGKQYEWIVWIDSDCQFKKSIPIKIYDNLGKKHGYFYFMGNRIKHERYGVETGFIGFNISTGLQVLQEWIDIFSDKKYKKYTRWDDGYVFLMILKERKFRGGIDIGKQNKSNNPINSPQTFYPYISHDKGIHRRSEVMY